MNVKDAAEPTFVNKYGEKERYTNHQLKPKRLRGATFQAPPNELDDNLAPESNVEQLKRNVLQLDQAPHADRTQSTGHSCVLQSSSL